MRRISAIAAVVAALALGACGGDDEETAPAGTGEETPTAPESATDPSTGAPDEGISGRPGGPEPVSPAN